MIFFLTITPNIVLFFANPWDLPLNSASESIVYHSAFFYSSFRRIVRRKETSSSRGKRDTQCNRERLANGRRYECFSMAWLLRSRHEYLLRKKVLMRALLRAKRRALRSYAKSIWEQRGRERRRETLNKRGTQKRIGK